MTLAWGSFTEALVRGGANEKALPPFQPLPFEKVFVGSDAITILFGRTPNSHTLYISAAEDRLYYDGERMKTTQHEFHYNEPRQEKGFEKKRVKTIYVKGRIIAVDVGWDGRIFIKLFEQKKYLEFKGKPYKVFSYWNCRADKEKRFYEDDLSKPKRVWEC